MRWFESPLVRWSIPAALATAWGLRLTLDLSLPVFIESAIGALMLIIGITLYKTSSQRPTVLWDEVNGIKGVIKTWTVESSIARLIASIPVGIDLSYNCNTVLTSMSTRMRDESGAELRFFLCRPLTNSVTRLGFSIVRKQVRFPNGVANLDKLSEKITIDAGQLESAMRSAFPHLPVVRAELNDHILVDSGGVLSDAL